MRPIELLIPIIITIYITSPWFFRENRPRWVTGLPLLTIILVPLHLLIEGYRWQMIPLYTLAGLSVLVSIFQIVKPTTKRFKFLSWKGILQTVTLILLAVFTALPVLLPVPKLSKPGGAFPVGTRIFTLVDTTRKERYSMVDEPRRFMIQVWYPADPKPEDSLAPWMENGKLFARAIAGYLGLPDFFLDHLQLVKIPAYRDAQPKDSGGPFPIILFSHGWNGFAAQNSNQALELASRGYIVVGMQHTYGALVTFFPDGKIAYNNPEALPVNVSDEDYDVAARLLADQWAGDLAYTLDFLETQNQDSVSPFHTLLDLKKIGVYGHSTGGGATIQFCATDMRCSSLLAMDPWVTPVSNSVLDNGFSQPAFFMFSQQWAELQDSKNNQLFYGLYDHLDPATHVIYIQGTSHYDFSDLPLLSPIAPQLGLKGPINGKLVNRIVNDYLVSFFDMTLKGKTTNLFATEKSPYPEVVYTR